MMDLYHWALRFLVVSYGFLLRPRSDRVRCLILREGKVLLVRNMGGREEWSLPGGGIKKNESPIDAARREVVEELKLELTDVESLGIEEIERDFMKVRAHLVSALARRVNFDPYKWEIREAGWFDVNNLPKPRSPLLKQALKLHKNLLDKA